MFKNILQSNHEESSDDEYIDEYDYQIVEFVKRGRPGTREIDIIPTKWLIYDKKMRKPRAFYKVPPYSEDDFTLIQDLAESKADAPDNWQLFTVKVVARASK